MVGGGRKGGRAKGGTKMGSGAVGGKHSIGSLPITNGG